VSFRVDSTVPTSHLEYKNITGRDGFLLFIPDCPGSSAGGAQIHDGDLYSGTQIAGYRCKDFDKNGNYAWDPIPLYYEFELVTVYDESTGSTHFPLRLGSNAVVNMSGAKAIALPTHEEAPFTCALDKMGWVYFDTQIGNGYQDQCVCRQIPNQGFAWRTADNTLCD
jgi:hypothetical protein